MSIVTEGPGPRNGIVAGVDTHAEVHVAAVIDPVGRELGYASFPTTTKGYGELLAWISSHGVIERVGIEGTGSYGAGLCRCLTAEGVAVVEVDRPDRQARRWCQMVCVGGLANSK